MTEILIPNPDARPTSTSAEVYLKSIPPASRKTVPTKLRAAIIAVRPLTKDIAEAAAVITSDGEEIIAAESADAIGQRLGLRPVQIVTFGQERPAADRKTCAGYVDPIAPVKLTTELPPTVLHIDAGHRAIHFAEQAQEVTP